MSSQPGVRIDQVFHGYDRGHKELASSCVLDEESRALMLIYSDLLADSGNAPEGSYLACYPLPSTSRHVLSRTWPAGAGARPGSVWTHSLILDYQALALVADLVALEPLLLRSGILDRGKGIKPLFVDAAIQTDGPLRLGESAGAALEGLYRKSSVAITVPSATQAQNDHLALALWRQMWPGLRRQFAFVTSVGSGAPTPRTGAMLLFDHAHRDQEPISLDPGLQALLEDLPAAGQTPLRRFLSRYAVEAPEPRRVAGPLAELWAQPADSLNARLASVRNLTNDVPLPRLTRDLLSAELERLDTPDALAIIVSQFGDQQLEIEPPLIARLAAELDERAFQNLITKASLARVDRLGGRVFKALVSASDLRRLAHTTGALDRLRMLQIRPDIITQAEFWPNSDIDRASLVGISALNISVELGWELFGSTMGPRTVQALLTRNTPSAKVILQILKSCSTETSGVVADYTLSTPNVFEYFMREADETAINHLAEAQLHSMKPPSSPSAWLSALDRLLPSQRTSSSLELSALIVMFGACLSVQGVVGLECAKKIYDPLQYLIRSCRHSYEQGRYLETLLWKSAGGWGVSGKITRTALACWPPKGGKARALTLSSNPIEIRSFVDETLSAFGRDRLADAMRDSGVPPAAREYSEYKLKTSGRKSWWF